MRILLIVLYTEDYILYGIICCWRVGKQNKLLGDTYLPGKYYYIIPPHLYLSLGGYHYQRE